MAEVLKIVRIGNSKGVRLPSAILRRQGFSAEIECIETLEGILLRPVKRAALLSFEEAFAQMARDRKALAEIRLLDGTISDGLEHDPWT